MRNRLSLGGAKEKHSTTSSMHCIGAHDAGEAHVDAGGITNTTSTSNGDNRSSLSLHSSSTFTIASASASIPRRRDSDGIPRSLLTTGSSSSSSRISGLMGVDSTQQESHVQRVNPTDVIRPRSDTFRRSVERASRSLTMNKLRFHDHEVGGTSSIYGRDKEIQQLKTAFEKATTVDRQLVVIKGPAGSGKSALANQLRTMAQQKGGFFLRGKFEQQITTGTTNTTTTGVGEPYAAFTMACRELCDALLAHKESPMQKGDKWQFSFEEVQTKLIWELDLDTQQVLTNVFSDLLQILSGTSYHATSSSNDENDESSDNDVYPDCNNNKTSATNETNSIIASMGYSEAKNRFHYAVRRLLRVIASFGRVCIFLDDCQWADSASLELLQNLVTDLHVNPQDHQANNNPDESKPCASTTQQQQGVIIMISYRSEEVGDDSHHPLCQKLCQIDADCPSLETLQINVPNLTRDQVNAMLMNVLSTDELEETLPLADCVHRKTEGNVLYVIQLMENLANKELTEQQQQPLLFFNMGTFKWEWNVQEIMLQERATENVVQTILTKLQSFPDEIRALLPVVACLGASFEKPILHSVVMHFHKILFHHNTNDHKRQNSALVVVPHTSNDNEEEEIPTDGLTSEPISFLEYCIREGVFVHDTGLQKVQWEHDKIQEASLALVNEEERMSLRLELGRFLMSEYGQSDLDRHIFILVNLLDVEAATDATIDQENTLILADLNWKAGVKAMQGAAFVSATMYLDRARKLLPKDHWTANYNLSLEVYSSAAQAHFCVGNLDEARMRCEIVCNQPGRSLLDKHRAYNVWMEADNAQSKTGQAMDTCLEVLAQLGCKFPKFGWTMNAMGAMIKTEMSLKALYKRIDELPVMTDASQKWVMQLLDMMATFCYQCHSAMFGMVIMKAFQYTLKHGICDFTPPMLCTVGMLMASVFSDIEGCNAFGEAALAMYDRSETSQSTKSRTLFIAAGFNLHWYAPTSNIRKNFLEGYKAGMGVGDAVSALWNMFCYLETGFQVGVPLAILEKDCHAYIQQMDELKQDKISLPTRAIQELVLSMLGRSDGWSRLLCAAEQPETDGNSKGHIARLHLLNIFWTGDYKETVALIEKHGVHKGEFDRKFHGAYAIPGLHFQCAVACFAVYAETRKKKYKQMATFHSKKVKTWSKHGNPNVQRYAAFVKAEEAALEKKTFADAIKLYKDAILLAGRQGIRHDQALANERLGDLYLRHDLTGDAQHHFDEAVRLYKDWGSLSRSQSVQKASTTIPSSITL